LTGWKPAINEELNSLQDAEDIALDEFSFDQS